jgi:putative serine protease PepD
MAAWVCPVCGRRVPGGISTCRCGSGKPPSAEPARPSAPGSAGGRVWIAYAIAFFVVAFGIGVALMWIGREREQGPPTRSTAARDGRRPVPAPAPAVETVPAPERTAAPEPSSPPPAVVPIPPESAPAPRPFAAQPSLEEVIGRAMPAVVRVETANAFGSGFFVAPDTVLTNAHVVSGSVSVTIVRSGGARIPARVDATSPEIDVAILRISNPDPQQPILTMGSGAQARAGQEVVVLGSPLGLQNTVTRGIVSAVRQLGAVTLVQTDAAVNPGNSGGPLLDGSGAVVGITTMGIQSAVAQGLSFAVASDHAAALLQGRRPAQPASPPVSALNQALSRSEASETEAMRELATREYEKALAQIARMASSLDDYWQRFLSSCYEGKVTSSSDHEWYAVWEPRSMLGAVSPGCGPYYADVVGRANTIRQQMLALEEAARQRDVFPGTRRDLRRKYHLDYSGWDR